MQSLHEHILNNTNNVFLSGFFFNWGCPDLVPFNRQVGCICLDWYVARWKKGSLYSVVVCYGRGCQKTDRLHTCIFIVSNDIKTVKMDEIGPATLARFLCSGVDCVEVTKETEMKNHTRPKATGRCLRCRSRRVIQWILHACNLHCRCGVW